MNIPQETLDKMQSLPEEKLSIIISLVDRLSMKPVDIFDRLCESGAKNPMTPDEIDNLIHKTRVESNAEKIIPYMS